MRKLSFFYILICLILTAGCSCESNSSNQKILPNYTGASGDLIVIMNSKHWNSFTGKALRKELAKPCPQFLSNEPQFDIDAFEPAKFSSLLKKFRNIIIADISNSDENQTAKSTFRKSVWAKDQLIMYIHAKDSTDFIEHLAQKADEIANTFALADRKRYARIIKKTRSGIAKEKLQNKFQLTIDIPTDYKLAKENPNEIWYKRDKMEYLSGRAYQVVNNIIVKISPFDSDSLFSTPKIIENVNQRTGPIIVSANYDQLKLEPRFEPICKEINLNGNYAMECRAAWKFEDPLMGGPFSSLTVHDPKNNRLITVEAFMFGPKFDKREYMREMEAILYSLNF